MRMRSFRFWTITVLLSACFAARNAAAAASPSIATQPQSQTNFFGSNVVFTVVASGQTPLFYQWSFEGTNLTDNGHIIGSATPTLTVNSITTNDTGNYQVVVTNSHGSATSSIVTLTVLVPAMITVQPTNQSVLLNSNVTLMVAATGTSPLAYQWYFNSSPIADGGRISGSSTANLNISSVQTTDAGSYQLVVTNNYGLATSVVETLTVLVPASIATQPTNQVWLLGGTAVFSSTAAGTAPLSYQWQKGGTNLVDDGRVSGSATATLTITDIQMSDLGGYELVVSNLYGMATSAPASLLVVPVVAWGGDLAGEINVPLTASNAVAISAGEELSLAVRSDGTVVGWGDDRYGEIDIPAGLTNAVAVSAGFGHSLALRSDGTVIGWGNNALGQSSVPPGLTNVVAVADGITQSLALRSDGTVVGWGNNSSGQLTPPAGLSNVVAIAPGSDFDLALLNDGTVVGWGANDYGQLDVPANLTNAVAVAAGFDHGLALRSDGTVIAWGDNSVGQTNVPPGLSNVVAIASGYDDTLALKSDDTVVAWGYNAYGQASPPTLLTNAVALASGDIHSLALVQNPAMQIPPGIWWQGSTNLPLTNGQTALINPYLSGSLPISFQWYFNGAPLPGQTNKWLLLTSVQPGQFGGYQFVATNAYGSVTSLVASVAQLPMIVTQPASQQILLGGSATFTAGAVGQAPLGYQWYFDGAALTDGGRISGSTTTNLSIANVQSTDAGSYQLFVSNQWGAVTSSVATLTVDVPVSIAVQPTNAAVLSGSTARFYVTPGGTPPFGYLWYTNGIALTNLGRISGATSSNLSIFSIQTNDSGTTFQVVVTNNYGAVTSAVVTLTVMNAAQVTSQPISEAVLLGGNVSFAITATGSGPLNYQWYFNGTPLTDNARISGSGTPALSISGVRSADAGGYVAVVTNALSSATSLTATLTPQAVLASSTRYVSLTSTNPSPPYLDWSTAATNIQDAIDAAVAGDSVIVSNGIYNSRTRAMNGGTTNRVAINKALTVQSFSGPAVTVITGSLFPAYPADLNVRCVYLTNGATLFGFTLTNGGTGVTGNAISNQSGGGAWCESGVVIISNCVFVGNNAKQYGGGAFRGTLINCRLTNNSANYGGGAASNTLVNCAIIGNTNLYPYAINGGGAFASLLNNCVISGNGASASGGAVAFGTLSNCLVIGNTAATNGGGSYYSTVYSCTFSNNSAGSGGGVFGGVINDSLISSNRASNSGGGAYSNVLNDCILVTNYALLGGGADFSVLSNCTVVKNSAPLGGGGTVNDKLYNCVIYFNSGSSSSNWYAGADVLNNCCTAPLAPGIANITNDPALVNLAGTDFHLQPNSPCINSGNNAYAKSATDFDGNPRIVGGTVDIGAFEYQNPGSVISYAYLQQYGLPTDGSVDFADLDGTSFNVYQDWIAGLNPTNSASILAMQNPVTNSTGLTVSWLSVNNRTYFLQRATNLSVQSAFSTIQSGISGQAGTTSVIDYTATNGGPYFYRVGVQ